MALPRPFAHRADREHRRGCRPLNRTRCKSDAGFCTATLVFVFWLPVCRAFRKKIEEMPDRAEIIARSERRVRGERRISMRYHAEAPAARCLEFLLRLRIVGRRHDEGGATLDMRQQAVE